MTIMSSISSSVFLLLDEETFAMKTRGQKIGVGYNFCYLKINLYYYSFNQFDQITYLINLTGEEKPNYERFFDNYKMLKTTAPYLYSSFSYNCRNYLFL